MSRLRAPEDAVIAVQDYYDGLMFRFRSGILDVQKFTVLLTDKCREHGISLRTFYRRSRDRRKAQLPIQPQNEKRVNLFDRRKNQDRRR